MDVISTMTVLAGIVLVAGTETSLSYYFYHYDDLADRRKTVTTTGFYLLAINALIAICVYLSADQITGTILGGRDYAVFLRIAILSIPFSSLVSLHLNVLRLTHRPWVYAGFSVSQLVLTVLLNVYLVVILRVGVIGVFWTNLVAGILYALLGTVINRAYFALSAIAYRRLIELLRYGAPLVIGGLSMWAIDYLDRYFLLRYGSLDMIGLYSVGLRLASFVTFITWAFRLANAPFQFEISSSPNAAQIYSRTLTYFVLLTSIVCVPLSLFARPFLRMLTTRAYIEAYTVVGLAGYSAVAYGVYQIVGVGLLVTKRTVFTGVAIGAGAIANVLYLFLLVPNCGFVGAAMATLLAHLTVVTFLYIQAQRVYPIPYDLKRIISILICSGFIISGGILVKTGSLGFEIIIAIGLFVLYLAMLFVFSLVPREEKRMILDSVKEFRLALRTQGRA